MTKIGKSKLYTKSGDQGLTSLVGGDRVSKSDLRIELYGDVDELNSHVGVTRSLVKDQEKLGFSYLNKVQIILFNMGSNLACKASDREKFKLPKITKEQIKELELIIDKVDSELAPLKFFILPGGTQCAASLHICRTVTRRIERRAIEFRGQNQGELPDGILIYLNRLSDFFFVLARYENHLCGKFEATWVPVGQKTT